MRRWVSALGQDGQREDMAMFGNIVRAAVRDYLTAQSGSDTKEEKARNQQGMNKVLEQQRNRAELFEQAE